MTLRPSTSAWLAGGPASPGEPLEGTERADVAIVGGGFTGLWSAIHLKDADPAAEVVVVEREVVGFGASGRNGGFAMTMVGRSLHDLLRKVGPGRARATYDAMLRTLAGIESFCAAEGIEADLTRPGVLTVSNGPEQDVRVARDVEAAERLGLEGFRWLDRRACQELVASPVVRCGHLEDAALLLDPDALVRGLREAAVRRGVRVYERTPVLDLAPRARGVELRTPRGGVRAERALVATGAYARATPPVRRFLFAVYAYIALTEPLSPEQWSRIGWERRMGIEDKRVMPHFHRPTPDGRILWGGRDAPYAPRVPDPRREADPRPLARLEETFRWTFPQLADVRIERGWTGPIDATVRAMPTVRWVRGERVLCALGYSAHGVAPSCLVGEVVRDLLLGRRSELLELPFTSLRPVPLPPEPLRGALIGGAQRLLLRADDRGGRGALARPLLRVLRG